MTYRYRPFNKYLMEVFGTRVYRVPVDAGFTCPNRDGLKAFGGCTFCDDRGSGAPTINNRLSVYEQLSSGIERIRKQFGAKKFLAYFQAFSNTYAPLAVLKNLYDTALSHPDVCGLIIGTRPDCVSEPVLDLLCEYDRRTFLYLELGVQSVFDKTLALLNRAHSAGEFFDAAARARARGLKVATHLIFGLPGENREQMLESVKQVAASDIQAIKIHQLCIYKGTPIEVDYRQGCLTMLEEYEYIELVADALELLPPEMIVMRLVAEGTKDELVAPAWSFRKNHILKQINSELESRSTRQGSAWTLCTATHCFDDGNVSTGSWYV